MLSVSFYPIQLNCKRNENSLVQREKSLWGFLPRVSKRTQRPRPVAVVNMGALGARTWRQWVVAIMLWATTIRRPAAKSQHQYTTHTMVLPLLKLQSLLIKRKIRKRRRMNHLMKCPMKTRALLPLQKKIVERKRKSRLLRKNYLFLPDLAYQARLTGLYREDLQLHLK